MVKGSKKSPVLETIEFPVLKLKLSITTKLKL